jgi:predicted  nucleic acid-binding Zn-ribbon protein
MKNISLILFLFIFTQCSSSHYAKTSSSPTTGGIPNLTQKESAMDNRLIIYNAYMLLVSKEPDKLRHSFLEIAKKYEGYVQQIDNEQMVLRIKSTELEKAMDEIGQLGKVKKKTVTGKDVTEEYMDFQIRLENLEKSRKRYLELLDKAQTVDEILKIEKELERLNGEIDVLKGKIQYLDNNVSLATIVVDIKEKVKPGLLGYIGIGLYHSVKWIFVRN